MTDGETCEHAVRRLRTLSYEAALYFYPLVMMDVTRLQSINTPAGTKAGFGPPNEFHHIRAFPTADIRAVVRPNFDTLYSRRGSI